MSRKVATHSDHEKLPPITDDMLERYLFSEDTGLSPAEKTTFFEMSKAYGLNPFKREIYCVKYGNNLNVVVGYEVYIKRAMATGQLNGWNIKELRDNDSKLTGAKITIYRKDFEYPFEWEVDYLEFAKPGNKGRKTSWDNMPGFMIKKVTIGQGFRLAFPAELGGMGYLQEELQDDRDHHDNKSEEDVPDWVVKTKPITPKKEKKQPVREAKVEVMEEKKKDYSDEDVQINIQLMLKIGLIDKDFSNVIYDEVIHTTRDKCVLLVRNKIYKHLISLQKANLISKEDIKQHIANHGTIEKPAITFGDLETIEQCLGVFDRVSKTVMANKKSDKYQREHEEVTK